MSFAKFSSNLNLSKILKEIGEMEDEISDGNNIDCDDLEGFIDDCEECYEKAYDLVRYAFKGSSSYSPPNIFNVMEEAESIQKLGEEVLKKAKSKDLCD